MVKKWKLLHSKQIADYHIFTVNEDVAVSPRTGKAHNFFSLHTKDWVNIIALTAEGTVVMVRQYRHGTRKITLEFPAGGIEPGDGNLEHTVIREFLEETGYTGDRVIHVGTADANPAFLSNKCHTYVVTNAVKKSRQSQDNTEDIVVEEIPVDTIPALIASGEISHSLSIVAYFWFMQNYFAKGGSEHTSKQKNLS